MDLHLPGDGRNDRKGATRRALLEAALTVFGEKGYHGAAVDEIVDKAGRSKGAAYFHFPSKEAIFRALIRELGKHLVDRIEQEIELAVSPIERLDAALLALIDIFVKHRTLARFMLLEVAGAGRMFSEDLIFVRKQFVLVIARQLDAGVEAGIIEPCDTALIATAWFGALNEVVIHWLHEDGAPPLQESYPSLRQLLLQSVTIDDAALVVA